MRAIDSKIWDLPTEEFDAELERLYGPAWGANKDKHLAAMKKYNARWEEMHGRLMGLQLLGTRLEKEGNNDGAIRAYCECVRFGEAYPRFTLYNYLHSLERLMVLYRKKKDFGAEIKVIEKVLSHRDGLAPRQVVRYTERLEKAKGLQSQ